MPLLLVMRACCLHIYEYKKIGSCSQIEWKLNRAWLDTRGNLAGKTQQLFTCTLVHAQESPLACTHTIAGLIKGVLKHLCQHCGAHRGTPGTVILLPPTTIFLIWLVLGELPHIRRAHFSIILSWAVCNALEGRTVLAYCSDGVRGRPDIVHITNRVLIA